jgi:hypothetical protein
MPISTPQLRVVSHIIIWRAGKSCLHSDGAPVAIDGVSGAIDGIPGARFMAPRMSVNVVHQVIQTISALLI